MVLRYNVFLCVCDSVYVCLCCACVFVCMMRLTIFTNLRPNDFCCKVQMCRFPVFPFARFSRFPAFSVFPFFRFPVFPVFPFPRFPVFSFSHFHVFRFPVYPGSRKSEILMFSQNPRRKDIVKYDIKSETQRFFETWILTKSETQRFLFSHFFRLNFFLVYALLLLLLND